MSTMWHYRPSKRPKVSDVHKWYVDFEDFIDTDWRGQNIWVCVENGYPYPDFYRVTYKIDGIKKSKLFYGEMAYNSVIRFVYDLGFRNVEVEMLYS